jgi:hypothetical protein
LLTRFRKASARQNVTWTVEWLDDQKNRQLTQTSSTCLLIHAQPFGLLEQNKGKKRKRLLPPALVTSSSDVRNDKPTREVQDQSIKLDVKVEVISQEREHSSRGGRKPSPDEEESTISKAKVERTHCTDHGHDGASTEPVGNRGHRFFLVKPRTNSSRTVLVPLEPTSTLDSCLNGRAVLEFPTIYVFNGSTELSPAEFMLEEDYLKQEGKEQKEFDQLISELDPEVLRRLEDDAQQSGDRTMKEERIDDKEILDVLKKDFGALF